MELFKAFRKIIDAAHNLSKLEDRLEKIVNRIRERFKFDLVAIQLVHPERQTVGTVQTAGSAGEWAGLALHYLEPTPKLRDIQVDIVLKQRYCEILSGWDDRFDDYIFDGYQHGGLCRMFAPILLVFDNEGEPLHGWFDECNIRRVDLGPNASRRVPKAGEIPPRRDAFELDLPCHAEVIGTIEVGMRLLPEAGRDSSWAQSFVVERATEVWRTISDLAPRIDEARFRSVLHAIVKQAREYVSATSATLHYPYDQERKRFVYEVAAGSLGLGFFKNASPRVPGGIGYQAIVDGEEQFAPGGGKSLAESNPRVAELGILSMAAFPLVEELEQTLEPVSIDESLSGKKGVLYFHFDKLLDKKAWKPIRTKAKAFVELSKNAIRLATSIHRMREHRRELMTLQWATRSLVESMNTPKPGESLESTRNVDLLTRLAWIIRSLLVADLVVLYEYEERTGQLGPGAPYAGTLLDPSHLSGELASQGTPAHLLGSDQDIILISRGAQADPILTGAPSESVAFRARFVEREKIEACAVAKLRFRDEIVGLLFINFRRPYHFRPQDRNQIEALSSAVSVAIYNHRLLMRAVSFADNLAERFDNLFGTLPLNCAEVRKAADQADLARINEELELLESDVARIKALRDAARTLREVREPAFENIDLNQVIQSEGDKLNQLGLLETDLTSTRTIRGHPTLVRDIIRHLIQNALYTNSSVKIRSQFEDGFVKLEFRNNAQSDRREDLSRAYEPFYTSRPDHVGLGLWVVDQTLRILGGKSKLVREGSEIVATVWIPHLDAAPD